MKVKPEKKDCPRYGATYDKELEIKTDSYNLAIDTYEAFLPNEEEMAMIIWKQHAPMTMGQCKDIAKAIAKRLGKE